MGTKKRRRTPFLALLRTRPQESKCPAQRPTPNECPRHYFRTNLPRLIKVRTSRQAKQLYTNTKQRLQRHHFRSRSRPQRVLCDANSRPLSPWTRHVTRSSMGDP